MRKVAVFFGGKSCENEISVLTGVFVLHLINREKFDPVPIYLHTDGGMYTSPKMTDLSVFRERRFSSFERVFFEGGTLYAFAEKRRKIKRLCAIDCALNCCHGGLGEGGGVSALTALNGIPLASPELTASGVFMDKSLTKVVLRGLGIPTVEYIRAGEKDYEKRGAFLMRSIESKLKYPVVIKPAHLGSSIGITLAKNETEARQAIEAAFQLDTRVIVEKYLAEKRDINCAAYTLNGEIFVSEPEEAFGAGIYSFEDKYVKRTTDGAGKTGERRRIEGELREKIRSYTKTVYKRMDLRGAVRMDFLVSGKQVYLCEVNTVPGSLAYYLFCERVSDAKNFFSDLLEDAILAQKQENKKLLTTGILNSVRWQGK